MSRIKIDLLTNADGDIVVDIKSECTLNELEVATGSLMGLLASSSTTGLDVVNELTGELNDRATSSEEDN